MIGVERLKEIELFRDLTTDELEAMSQICEVKTYEAGSVIFKEGDEGKEIYVVDEGMVNCMIHPTPDQPIVVCTRTRNSLIGWAAMVPPCRYTATAKAEEKTRVFAIDADQLRKLCDAYPHICDKVMQRIVTIERLRQTELFNGLTTDEVELASLACETRVEFVELEGEERLKADLVFIAIGTKPNTELAQNAGLDIGEQKGISVDEYMRTSDPDILAAGDCAEKYSFFTRKPIGLRLASIAAREGKIAAANILVPKWRNEGTLGVFATVIGDLAVGVCGLTEDQARKEGFSVIIGESTGVDRHPATMPGAREVGVKLLFDRKSGKMLGGSVCCSGIAGEMANLMAAAIVSGMRIEELAILPMGTHPALTASPFSTHITEAACQVLSKAGAI